MKINSVVIFCCSIFFCFFLMSIVKGNEALPLKKEIEYTGKINNYIQASKLQKIESGKRQGKKEIYLYLLLLIILLVPLLQYFIGSNLNKDKLFSFIACIPNIINLNYFLLLNSLGEWGSYKHPSIHPFAESIKGNLWSIAIFSILVSVVLFAYLIGSKCKHNKSIRFSVALNVVIYILATGGFFLFSFFVSGLASQGAGH